jgi:glycosyltransferase involved in cell wall biosynthesis
MDVFALTSRSEGLPLVVLEACAAGVPVVATEVGGLTEMITSGKNGILVPFGDQAALVDSLHSVLTESELRARLRQSGLEWVQSRYSLDRMAADYQGYYLSAINSLAQSRSNRRTLSPAIR